MLLINCEINLVLTWSKNYLIAATAIDSQVPTFGIINTNVYVLIVTLSNQDNVKLLKKLNSDFKRKINWNKYQLSATI